MKNINPVVRNPRRVNYLRVSLTDRCNLRCSYCMPKEGIFLQPQDKVLTFEEIVRLVRIFSSTGVRKIRLTGGEPLVRKGIAGLITQLSGIEGIEEVALTTNGTLLPLHAQNLKNAGIKNINISLDTLNPVRFKSITGSDSLGQALEGIEIVKALGFNSIKINMVVMKGVNDDEIGAFVRFAVENNLTLRFIEFMKVTPLWDDKLFMPIEEIREICQGMFDFKRTEYRSLGPAQYYEYKGNLLGFIKTSYESCQDCSRLRLTATGELKSCLYQAEGISLRDSLRGGASSEELRSLINDAVALKSDINYSSWDRPKIYMHSVGG